ncbi:hypothetical protein AB1Y20_006322 [Prymnesium parvum]|uniref:PCIF1 WW domain-containing protein n=1 Tax=Prymnesium parvum TaxID=97485 RepID=A0AB34J4T2_PRYPA
MARRKPTPIVPPRAPPPRRRPPARASPPPPARPRPPTAPPRPPLHKKPRGRRRAIAAATARGLESLLPLPPAAPPALPPGHHPTDDASHPLLDARPPLPTDAALRLAPPLPSPPAASPLLPSPPAASASRCALAAAELAAVRRLGEAFRACVGGKHWYAHFERWLWAARRGGGGGALPRQPAAAAMEALRGEMARRGEAAAAEAACAAVCGAAAEAAAAAARGGGGGGGGVAVRRGVRGEAELLELRCAGEAVVVREAYLLKLWALYRRHAAAADRDGFLCAAFAALARLLALQGGQELAGGMQAACPAAVFDTLRLEFGVTMELFASPVNTRFPQFCSAAEDVDHVFGSHGSFFDFTPLAGAFIANPPFDPSLVLAMATRMESLLHAADEASAELTFVVVLPRWQDEACWQALQRSPYSVCEVRMGRSKHAYIDGGQHYARRKDPRPRLSNHDSSVFFFQSKRAAGTTRVTPEKQQKLRDAFRGGW